MTQVPRCQKAMKMVSDQNGLSQPKMAVGQEWAPHPLEFVPQRFAKFLQRICMLSLIGANYRQ